MGNFTKGLTPRGLADAIGVSESSIRRWVDSGEIRMSRTAGGHRRIAVSSAIQFIRRTRTAVVRPDLLGLGERTLASGVAAELPAEEKLYQALTAGERKVAYGVILSSYLKGESLAALFDGPVAHAMRRVGELWKHSERGILVEHRATEICIGAILQLRDLTPALGKTAPLALGGSPRNDPYILPTTMVAAVLAEAGFIDINFGANTPVELLLDEAIDRGARLVWISVSTPQGSKPQQAAIQHLAAGLARRNIHLLMGGRFAGDCAPRGLSNVIVAGSMGELSAFARGVLSG
jgi:excisionase family DNA binding protein